MEDPKLLGRWGEDRCRRFLRKKGFKTIARNFTCKAGEIDLVAGNSDGTIVFVEVKTRRNEDYAQAQDAITRKKKTTMIRAAKSFLRKYKIKDKALRFDVVAIILGPKGPPEIRHYENAFTPPFGLNYFEI